LNEVQVRKDLALVDGGGKPKTGFELEALVSALERFLGYDNVNEAVLVGVGHLGRALLSYKEFEASGLKIVVGFDSSPGVVGTTVNGREVLPTDKIIDLCQRMKVHIGIIAVPAEEAQKACDLLVRAGILAIWNFAPIHLNVPGNILLQNENLAASLTVLSRRLSEKLRQG
jgi:redox-sensing transcriptional repressor